MNVSFRFVLRMSNRHVKTFVTCVKIYWHESITFVDASYLWRYSFCNHGYAVASFSLHKLSPYVFTNIYVTIVSTNMLIFNTLIWTQGRVLKDHLPGFFCLRCTIVRKWYLNLEFTFTARYKQKVIMNMLHWWIWDVRNKVASTRVNTHKIP